MLEPLEIPDKVGKVHTIRSTSVLLISGDRGFSIFDKNFKLLYERALYEKKAQILFAD